MDFIKYSLPLKQSFRITIAEMMLILLTGVVSINLHNTKHCTLIILFLEKTV